LPYASPLADMTRNNLQHFGPLLVYGFSLCAGVNAQAAGLMPSAVFIQAGFGDQDTDAYLAGLTWTVPLQYMCDYGWVGAFVEGAFGRWRTEGRQESTAWPTQISATPTLRFYPSKMSPWFAELGVGANYIVPLFRSGHKRFSTEFNFGDHAAVGRAFGRSEVSLRIEHFSNAGISHPNPGENFVQLRYAYRL
jgi:lipid A 3-O-deacylase